MKFAHILDYAVQSFRQCWSYYYSCRLPFASGKNSESPYPLLSSIPIGVAASLSVIAHEIPQEVGDFAILLHGGYSKRKALSLNILSSLSTVPGAILAYYTLEIVRAAIPYVMAISAASFLYIALADLSPELHREVGFLYAIRQFLLMLAGVGTIILFLQFHP